MKVSRSLTKANQSILYCTSCIIMSVSVICAVFAAQCADGRGHKQEDEDAVMVGCVDDRSGGGL